MDSSADRFLDKYLLVFSALAPVLRPRIPIALLSLTPEMLFRFEQSGMEGSEEAIVCHREAFALSPRGHPSRSLFLSNLGNTLWIRFDLKLQTILQWSSSQVCSSSTSPVLERGC